MKTRTVRHLWLGGSAAAIGVLTLLLAARGGPVMGGG